MLELLLSRIEGNADPVCVATELHHDMVTVPSGGGLQADGRRVGMAVPSGVFGRYRTNGPVKPTPQIIRNLPTPALQALQLSPYCTAPGGAVAWAGNRAGAPQRFACLSWVVRLGTKRNVWS
jgi:hypothetical protein